MLNQIFKTRLLAQLFFKEKKSRYCHHSCVVVVGGGIVVVIVIVVTHFNLGNNFVEANLMKLNMLVHHHMGYNLTITLQGFLTKLCPFIDMQNGLRIDYRSVNSLACVLIIGKSMAWNVC